MELIISNNCLMHLNQKLSAHFLRTKPPDSRLPRFCIESIQFNAVNAVDLFAICDFYKRCRCCLSILLICQHYTRKRRIKKISFFLRKKLTIFNANVISKSQKARPLNDWVKLNRYGGLIPLKIQINYFSIAPLNLKILKANLLLVLGQHLDLHISSGSIEANICTKIF